MVFGDDNAHGSSMVTTVGPPGGLDSAMVPSKAASRRSMPRRPVPAAASAPPRAVVVDHDRAAALPSCRSRHPARAWRAACLTTLVSASATAK